jgi:hypothetical protein
MRSWSKHCSGARRQKSDRQSRAQRISHRGLDIFRPRVLCQAERSISAVGSCRHFGLGLCSRHHAQRRLDLRELLRRTTPPTTPLVSVPSRVSKGGIGVRRRQRAGGGASSGPAGHHRVLASREARRSDGIRGLARRRGRAHATCHSRALRRGAEHCIRFGNRSHSQCRNPATDKFVTC